MTRDESRPGSDWDIANKQVISFIGTPLCYDDCPYRCVESPTSPIYIRPQCFLYQSTGKLSARNGLGQGRNEKGTADIWWEIVSMEMINWGGSLFL